MRVSAGINPTYLMEERFRADPIQPLAPKQLSSYSQHTQERKKGCSTRKKGRYTVTKLEKCAAGNSMKQRITQLNSVKNLRGWVIFLSCEGRKS